MEKELEKIDQNREKEVITCLKQRLSTSEFEQPQ
jgi:hypothetical protein